MEILEQEHNRYCNALENSAQNVISVNADAKLTLQYEQTHNVVLPPDEKQYVINSSNLKRIKKKCIAVKKQCFPKSDVLLGIANLFMGAFLSALISQIQYDFNPLSIFFYGFCPVVSVGAGIAYYFCKKNSIDSIANFANSIDEQLPSYDEEEEN